MSLEGGRETGEVEQRVEHLRRRRLGDECRKKLEKLIDESDWRPG